MFAVTRISTICGTPPHFGQIVEHTEHFAERLRAFAERGETLDFERQMALFTMGGVTSTLLGSDVHTERLERVADALTTILNFADDRVVHYPFNLPLFFPTASRRAYDDANAAVVHFVDELLHNDRIADLNGIERDSLLRDLRRAHERGAARAREGVAENGELELSADSLHAQIRSLFIGGHETTAHLLTMAFYRIAKNPEILAKLMNEIDTVLKGGAPLNADAISRMNYLNAVVQETLRVDSSIFAIPREALEDIEVGGYVIRRGTLVLAHLDALHRLPKFWKDAETFDPERFTAENRDSHHECGRRHPRAASPFGIGARQCVGRFFAIQEAKIALVTWLRMGMRFAEMPECVEQEVVCTTRVKGGMPVKLRFERP